MPDAGSTRWDRIRGWLIAGAAVLALVVSFWNEMHRRTFDEATSRSDVFHLEEAVQQNTQAIEELGKLLKVSIRTEERVTAIERRVDRQDRQFDRQQEWLAQQLSSTNQRLSDVISLLRQRGEL